MEKAVEDVRGEYRRTLYQTEDSGFFIGVLTDETKVIGTAEEIPVPGLQYRFVGTWENSNYGRQFRFDGFVQHVPPSRDAVTKYLAQYGSGIGTIIADKIIREYGVEHAIDRLKDSPEAVSKAVPGLSLDNALKTSETLVKKAQFESTRIELLKLLQGRGFGSKGIDIALEKWGINAADKIKANPFILMLERVPGAGFMRCDALYLDLGLDPHAIMRQMLCLWNQIEKYGDGSTWYVSSALQEHLKRSIGGGISVEDAIELGIEMDYFIRHPQNEDWVAIRHVGLAELYVAEWIAANSQTGPSWASEASLSRLSEHQAEQVVKATSGQVGILTGGPGTGKTYCLGNVLSSTHCGDIIVACPTGKAAVRATQSLDEAMKSDDMKLTAKTIHSLLKPHGVTDGRWSFEHDKSNPIQASLVVIDEASMVDVVLMAQLLESLPKGCRVLIIGDPEQLMPVGAGKPFLDIIRSQSVPHGHLSKPHRFSGRIGTVCSQISQGKPKEIQPASKFELEEKYPENYVHIERASESQQRDAVCQVIKTMQDKGFKASEIQVLVALNERSQVSRKPLNLMLQSFLNMTGAEIKKSEFRKGDRVINLSNRTYFQDWGANSRKPVNAKLVYVANGEMGTIVDFEKPRSRTGAPRWITVRLEISGKSVRVTRSQFASWTLGYAVTTHKSQGSQWPVVIAVVDGSSSAERIANRSHAYTGMSRASKALITVGTMSALQKHLAIRGVTQRKTWLSEQIGWMLSLK